VNATKDLESEIHFLNEQIVYADKHNEKLRAELASLKDEIHKYDQNANFEELVEDVVQLPNQRKIHKDLSEVKHSLSAVHNNNNRSVTLA
jgi:phage shock protein A